MAKRKGRPPKIDESGREILREIVTAQPHATLDECDRRVHCDGPN